MRRAPVHLDDAAIGAAFETDPIPGPVGSAEAQHNARKHIAQRALERQAENDRDRTRGCEQPLDREVEDVGDDGEDGDEINQARQQILEQLALARPVLDDDEGAQKADQEPRCPEPPSDLQSGVDGIAERRAGQLQRLIGHDIRVQQNNSQKNQEYDAYDGPRERTVLQQEMRRQPTQHHQTERNDQGVLLGGLHNDGQIDHPNASPRSALGNTLAAADLYQQPRLLPRGFEQKAVGSLSGDEHTAPDSILSTG